MDWAGLLQLVPQAGLALVFAWFARDLLKSFQAAQEQRDAVWVQQLQAAREAAEKERERRDASWQAFTVEQHKSAYSALNGVTQELREVAQQIVANTTLLAQHDRYTREYIAREEGRGGPAWGLHDSG